MTLPIPWAGLIGDFLTFAGGLVLAVDAGLHARHFTSIQSATKAFKSPELAKLVKELGHVRIRDPQKDVEYAFIRRSSRLAFVGAFGLTLGFSFLLAARVMEIMNSK